MRQPRIKTVKKKPETIYIIHPEYIKAKVDLENALKTQSEYLRLIDYCIENGATEFGLVRSLHTINVDMCLKSVVNQERFSNVLNGSPFLKENGFRDDLLDDLY